MIKLTLSRRNLLTLLSKLDRAKAGEHSARTLIKGAVMPSGILNLDTGQVTWNTDVNIEVAVTAEEDEVVYANRTPGEVLPVDAPRS